MQKSIDVNSPEQKWITDNTEELTQKGNNTSVGYRPASASFGPCLYITLIQFTDIRVSLSTWGLWAKRVPFHWYRRYCNTLHQLSCFAYSSSSADVITTRGSTRRLFPNNINPGLSQSSQFLHLSSKQLHVTARPPHNQHHPSQQDETYLTEEKNKCLSKKEQDQIDKISIIFFPVNCMQDWRKLYAKTERIKIVIRKDGKVENTKIFVNTLNPVISQGTHSLQKQPRRCFEQFSVLHACSDWILVNKYS